jgi:gas vesicle protein
VASSVSDKKFLVGLVVGLGLGLGVAAALLISPSGGSRRRSALSHRAREVADRMSSLRFGAEARHRRRVDRAGRALMDRIDRARSAGF